MSDFWIFDFSKILGTFYQLDVEWVSFAVFLFLKSVNIACVRTRELLPNLPGQKGP